MHINYTFFEPAMEQHINAEDTISDCSFEDAFKWAVENLPTDHIDYIEFKIYP